MTVDLSKLKSGDEVIFRNGEKTQSITLPEGFEINIPKINNPNLTTAKTDTEYKSTIAGITGKGDLSKKPHPRALNPDLLKETANAFRFGQLKHGVDNFRKMDSEAAGEVFDALLRHLLDYMAGETHAKDSGLHHLAHADANLHILYRIIKRSSDQEILKVISGGDIK
jgi:hypothetical protein